MGGEGQWRPAEVNNVHRDIVKQAGERIQEMQTNSVARKYCKLGGGQDTTDVNKQ